MVFARTGACVMASVVVDEAEAPENTSFHSCYFMDVTVWIES